MRRGLLVVIALIAACDDGVNGLYDELPLEGDFTVGVSRPVHVVRDAYGIAHIDAQTVGDAAFVQGYVMAHDRLPQMDILRRFGAGTLSELFGALDPTVIDTDLEMRMHRMRPLAEQAWLELQASTSETDQEVVRLLQRFADGVNVYATSIRTDINPDGAWELDPDLLVSFDPTRFVPWHPIDSLVLGRFQAFALSWTTPVELDLTELHQNLYARYDLAAPADAAAHARRGLSRDLLALAPIGRSSTIPGFPNVAADSGARSDGSDPQQSRRAPATPHATGASAARPTVPQTAFERARTFFARGLHTGPFGAPGPHAFMHPHAGSNNWALGPSRTGDGSALLASDQHLQLPNPSIFYPTHLIVRSITVGQMREDGELVDKPLDVIGVTFPGIPGVILGSNGFVAWSATVSEHDVNDVYLETIAPCATDATVDCVLFDGAQVPLTTTTETIRIGALGTITGEVTATYEHVPHHGPIIPELDPVTHQLVPRTASSALSVRYTGYRPSFEIRALWNLGRADSIDAGFRALADFGFGSQNWTMIDHTAAIGWTTHAVVPDRVPAAHTWNAETNPTGLAPFFVLPGDGSAEWREAPLSSRYIPHVKDPASGVIVTANADPVGATFDGDPLNQPVVDGHSLYVGVTYAAGLRQERITNEITEVGAVATLPDMAAIQHDTLSTMGLALTPALVAALARLDAPSGMPADLAPYIAALPADDRARLDRARALLGAWTFATPTGLEPADSATDSAATAVFNAWMHFFVERALADELGEIAFDVWRLGDTAIARIVHAVLVRPDTLVASAATLEPVVCDVFADLGPDDSCSKLILQALVDAMTHLESSAGFGTADVAAWSWGTLHRLVIKPLFPNPDLELPGPGLPGFPRRGDNFAVNRADQGWDDLDFSQSADGPAQRFLAIASPRVSPMANQEPIRVKWALPGGVIFDSRSSHYRDLLDNYYLTETHFDAPYLTRDILAAAESRWRFR